MEVKREKAFAFHLKGTVQCRDPDREMRCGGGGAVGGGEQSSRPLEKGGGPVSKKFFSVLQASVWSKNKGGAGPLPLPWIRHGSGDSSETFKF